MVYTYTPTYYTSLHDSITSICKNILPFSFKKRRLPAIAAAEQRLWKQQTDNLKWQQESFHQILNLMGLCKEGIIQEGEVSTFKTHLLETIITSPIDHEPATILRDKLIFLQELFYAKCISEDEYHSSKRPLLQRLAVQGAVIGAKDLIIGAQTEISSEEWAVIDLKDKQNCSIKSEVKMKGSPSVFSFGSTDNNTKSIEDIRSKDRNLGTVSGNELVCSTENPFWKECLKEKESESKSILMLESLPETSTVVEKQESAKKSKEKAKLAKKGSWGFDRLMKWKKNDTEDETAPLSLIEKSDEAGAKGLDTEQIKKPHPSDQNNDKVLGRNMKEELSRIQAELRAKNTQVHLSDDRIDEVATHLPVNNDDLKKFFPKSWCDQHGEAVLQVVKREYKDHVEQIGNYRPTATTVEEKHNSKRWTTFDDDEENTHPNVFAANDVHHHHSAKQARFSLSKNANASFNSSSSIDKGFKYNPFFDMM